MTSWSLDKTPNHYGGYGFIYSIYNVISGKKYIGQTILSPHIRFLAHKNSKRSSLYKQMIKEGLNNFKIEVIDITYDQNELNQKEMYYIELYKTCNSKFGYNKHTGGGKLGSFTEDVCLRISKGLTGKKKSKEHIEKVRQANLGKRRSEQSIYNMKKAKKHKAKAIYVINEDCSYITLFCSIREAARQLKTSNQSINRAIKNKKTHRNYFFCYENDLKNLKNIKELFYKFKINNKYYKTLNEITKDFNITETTAFRSVKRGFIYSDKNEMKIEVLHG